MKLLSPVVVVFSLVSLAVAEPIPLLSKRAGGPVHCHKVALSIQEPLTPKKENKKSPLVTKPGVNSKWCTVSPPGTCSFAMMTTHPLYAQWLLRDTWIFDHNCTQVGRSSIGAIHKHVELTPKLPHKLELDIKCGGFEPEGWFIYDGRWTFLGKNLKCKSCSVWVAPRECCQLQFEC